MSETIFAKGSPAARVCEHLHTHAGVLLSRRDLANLLQIVPGAVDAAIEPAVLAGWVISAHDADIGRYWKAGPKLQPLAPSSRPQPTAIAPAIAATIAAATARPAPAAQAPAKPATKYGPRKPAMPQLELATLTVSADVPLPMPAIAMKGQTKHDALFNSLTADGMSVTGIPIDYQAALLKATQAYLSHHPEIKAVSQLFVRKLDDATCGIWRVARTQDDDAVARHRVRRANKLRAAA